MNKQERAHIAAHAVCQMIVDVFEGGGESVDWSALEDCYRAAKCVVGERKPAATKAKGGA